MEYSGNQPQFILRRGDAHKVLGHRELALKDFSSAAGMPNAAIGSFFNAAMIEAEDGKFAPALNRLIAAKNHFAGSVNFRSGADRVIACCFDRLLVELAKLILADQRSVARQHAFDILQQINDCQKAIDAKPLFTPAADSKRIVFLANLDLRQCAHYRVEQKIYQFARLGLKLEVYDARDPVHFITALPGALAALFYRVSASPIVMQAIELAKALGLPTFYDIDDLIFDEIFPDTFQSYQGQITKENYRSLQRDVPNVRFAMSLCDYGIASTIYLAGRMERVVSSGKCFVVPNGLDERSDAAIKLADQRPRTGGRVTIFYGSGTKAHNKDFNDVLGPALWDVLNSHDHVDLIIVGHLKLHDSFGVFAGRIQIIDFISDVDAYWTFLGGCDINLWVLAKNPVTDAKSEINGWKQPCWAFHQSSVRQRPTSRLSTMELTVFSHATPQNGELA